VVSAAGSSPTPALCASAAQRAADHVLGEAAEEAVREGKAELDAEASAGPAATEGA
jgi:hypothetical protein